MKLIELPAIFPDWLLPWLVTAASLCITLVLQRIILVHLETTFGNDSRDHKHLLMKSANVLLLIYLPAELQLALDRIDISNSLLTSAILIIAIIIFADRFPITAINLEQKEADRFFRLKQE